MSGIKFFYLALSCALLTALTGPARAVETPAAAAPAPNETGNPLAMSGGGPLEVTAQGSLEWHEAEQMYLARGQAKVVRGDITIMAEELRAFQRPKQGAPAVKATDALQGGAAAPTQTELYKFTAKGNVQINSKAQQIYGDDATYDADAQVARLTGNNLRFVGPDETVTAQEALEYWPEKKQAIARGRAVATRADRKVEADRLIANFRADKKGNLELSQLIAEGRVIITTKTDAARGDRAVYDVLDNKAKLSGAVQITRGPSQLAGSLAEVDFKTGISRMLAGGGDGKVRALFVPDANKGPGALASPAKNSSGGTP